MSGFLKAFGLGRGKELNYDIGEPIEVADDFKYRVNWVLHKGYHKETREEATIFSFDIKPNSDTDVLELCKNCIRRMKTLMLPNVLKYLDGIELPTGLFVVTEPVIPLSMYLQSMDEEMQYQSREFISWGLYSVIRGLEHLHNGGFVHGNFGMHSVYVNKAGDWKLFGLDWCSQLNPPADGSTQGINHFKMHHDMIPNELKAPELLKANFSLIEASPIYAVDAWALGLFFVEIFNHQVTSSTTPNDLKNPGNMPRPLFGAFMGLISHTAKLRMNPAKLLQEGANEYFTNNEYVWVQEQLDNMVFMLRDPVELEHFLRKLEKMIPTFPKANCKYKILPKIAEATQFGSGGTAALTTILKLGEVLNSDEYQTLVIPGLLALFTSRDSNVRMQLLQSIPMYVTHLREPTTTTIWNHVSQGFASSYAEIREITIKALVHLTPHLPEKLVSSEVMKHLWQLQTDKEGGIRTNAIICLGKLAPTLSPTVREKMLLPSFSRSLKDPFHHSRVACCHSFAATAEFYSDKQLAEQILPAVAPLTADSTKEVRAAAFKCIQHVLTRLQKMSDGLIETVPKMETTSTVEGSGYLGWAFSSMKTKIYGEGEGPSPSHASSSHGREHVDHNQSHSSVSHSEQNMEYSNDGYGYGEYSEEKSYGEAVDQSYDGYEAAPAEQGAWNDDLSDFDEGAQEAAAPAQATPAEADGWGEEADGWEEDEIEEPPPPPPKPKPVTKPVRTSPISSTGSIGSGSKTASGSSGMELKKKPVKKSLGAARKAD